MPFAGANEERTLKSVSLIDRYELEEGSAVMTGVQALVRLALSQRRADMVGGIDSAMLISGYEGSPLAGYDLELARNAKLLEEHRIVHQPAVNEELGATAVLGSQLAHLQKGAVHDGVLGLWYGKAPGLDRAADALRHANLMGVDRLGGAVAVVGDDAAPKSSTVPSGSELALMDLGMPTIVPADVQDVLDLGLHAFALSRASGLWVGMKLATNVADGSATVILDPSRVAPAMPDMHFDGVEYKHNVSASVIIPQTLLDLERTMHGPRLEIARRYGAANGLNRIVSSAPTDRIGLIACGKPYRDVLQALESMGIDAEDLATYGIRLLKVAMPFPMDPTVVREFASGLDEIIVVEEKRAFVELMVKDILFGIDEPPKVFGKYDDERVALLPAAGELDADVVARAVGRRLLTHWEMESVVARMTELDRPSSAPGFPIEASRTPYFCSGCPHSTSTKVPDNATVGAGIGCHGLVMLMSPDEVGDVIGVTQMGGEGAQWVGMSPFVSTEHLIQNVGDGTFYHSASLAVRAAVAAGSHITYKILFNSAVAMTGGQDIVGGRTVPELAALLASEGVARTIVTTDAPDAYRGTDLPKGVEVWHRDRIIEAQETLARVDGVTAIIHEQECATELRRKRKRKLAVEPAKRIFINERVCEGCGDCGVKSNCLSVRPVQTEFGRKTEIHQASCNKDFSCLAGDCPSFLEVIPPAKARANPVAVPSLTLDDLPAPIFVVPDDEFSIRLTGVGGTGIVTVAQVIAMAAHLDDRHVHALDQLGMAQKGGPVVSDVRISRTALTGANKLSEGQCDLYLCCDIVTGASPKYWGPLNRDRTVAVLSTASLATAGQVVDVLAASTPVDSFVRRIQGQTRPDVGSAVNAERIALALFGTDQVANMLMVGVAYQAGALPLSIEALERAIEINGTAVEMNLQAIRRGRQAVADPEGLEAAIAALAPAAPAQQPPGPETLALIASTGAPAESELARLLAVRIPDLVAYQNVAYARHYADLVGRVRAVEERRLRMPAGPLSEAVATYAYKLMAYKDEYEVARLQIDPQLQRALEAEFGPGARVSWKLHPPVLRAMGMKKKLTLGRWFAPAFRCLYAMRRLRGTAFDVFGYAAVRRLERELVVEYVTEVERLLQGLTPDNHDIAVEIAGLPDMVRGYEHIKTANAAQFRTALGEAQRRFAAAGPSVDSA